MNKEKQLSMVERWELDVESYQDGANVLTSIPQCEKCRFYIKSDALHCEQYQEAIKPKYVMFPNKECPKFIASATIDIKSHNQIEEKLFGGIFGLCVADALGVPVEFKSRIERQADPVCEMRAYGTYHQPFGTWSDDTSLTLCLIDGLRKNGSLETIAKNFVDYYTKAKFTPHGEVFDIGFSTRNAIEKMMQGIEPSRCGGITESDNGNGSLMRILPLAYYVKDMPFEKQKNIIENVSALTHGHKRSKLACILYVMFAIKLLECKEKQEAFMESIQDITEKCFEEYAVEWNNFGRIFNNKISELTESEISSSGYVVHSLEASLWAFLTTNSYEEAILRAINLGEDTDTIAAIAGGLAGIYYGVSAIPNNWIQCLARKEEIYEMLLDFNEVLKK